MELGIESLDELISAIIGCAMKSRNELRNAIQVVI